MNTLNNLDLQIFALIDDNFKQIYDIKCRIIKVIEKLQEAGVLDARYKPSFSTKGIYFKPKQPIPAKYKILQQENVHIIDSQHKIN